MTELMIKSIAEALKYEVSINHIHDVLKNRGFSEEEIFLAVKAGQFFLNHTNNIDRELAQRKLPFSRVK